MSDNALPKRHKRGVFSNTYAREEILSKLSSKLPKYSNNLPRSVKRALRGHGPAVAKSRGATMGRTPRKDSAPVDVIANAGVITVPEKEVPNEYEFEILRLRRRVEELECIVRDRDERNVRAISMLEDELQMWRTFLHAHVKETYNGIQRRIVRIESTLMTLREKENRFAPSLPIPESWKKRER